MSDVERSKIVTDHRHHAFDRDVAHDRQPVAFRHLIQRAAILLRQGGTDRLEIIAGIQPLRDRSDVLAERLAIA